MNKKPNQAYSGQQPLLNLLLNNTEKIQSYPTSDHDNAFPISNFDQSRETPKLLKTKLCWLYNKGKCKKGASCAFAHGLEELKDAPDLYKTSLCIPFQTTCKCPFKDRCKFAHGESELRVKHSKDMGPTEAKADCIPIFKDNIHGGCPVTSQETKFPPSYKVLFPGDEILVKISNDLSYRNMKFKKQLVNFETLVEKQQKLEHKAYENASEFNSADMNECFQHFQTMISFNKKFTEESSRFY